MARVKTLIAVQPVDRMEGSHRQLGIDRINQHTDFDFGRRDRKDIDAAMGAVFPVIELHDCLRNAPEHALTELIARRGLHAGFVAADRPVQAVSETFGVTVEIDGRRQGEYVDADPRSHIVEVLRWLHSRLLRDGGNLRRGQIVLCGTRMGLYPVSGPCRLAVTTSTGIRVEATMVP